MTYIPRILNHQTGNMGTIVEWIPVAQRLPDDDRVVLVACPDSSEPVWFGFYSEDDEWVDPDSFRAIAVTHWMELPPTPQQLEATDATQPA